MAIKLMINIKVGTREYVLFEINKNKHHVKKSAQIEELAIINFSRLSFAIVHFLLNVTCIQLHMCVKILHISGSRQVKHST